MTTGLKFWTAFLADYASPRNGVLTVVNGGINILYRDTFPAAMKLFLAGFIQIPIDYKGGDVAVSFVVRSTENEDIYARIESTSPFPAAPPDTKTPALAPLVVDFSEVRLPRLGLFAIDAKFGDEQITLEFQVLPSKTAV